MRRKNTNIFQRIVVICLIILVTVTSVPVNGLVAEGKETKEREKGRQAKPLNFKSSESLLSNCQSYKSSSLLALNILTIFVQMLGNHTH